MYMLIDGKLSLIIQVLTISVRRHNVASEKPNIQVEILMIVRVGKNVGRAQFISHLSVGTKNCERQMLHIGTPANCSLFSITTLLGKI